MGKRDATTIAAVLGRKHISAVFQGESAAIVDDHSHRGRMRLDQHTRNEVGDEIVAEIVALVGRAQSSPASGTVTLVLQVRPLAAMSRIFVGPRK